MKGGKVASLVDGTLESGDGEMNSEQERRAEMDDFKTRMVDEYKQLLERIDKLDKAVDWAADTDEVSDSHYRLMRVQYFAMCAYEGALRARIDDLGLEV